MQTAGLKAFHLSLQQARLWSLQGDSKAYRAQCAVLIEGPLDVALFLQTLGQVVNRHAVLRTKFYLAQGMEVSVQVVAPRTIVSCPTIDLAVLGPALQEEQIDKQFTSMQESRRTLESNYLLHIALLRLSMHAHVLQLALPALCADASTLKHLISEIQEAYVLGLQGQEFTDDPLQYADVSSWQKKLLVAEDAEEQKAYWRKMAISQPASVPFAAREKETPRDQSMESGTAFAPRQIEVPVEAEVLAQLQALVQKTGNSYEACLLACWQILLWRMAGASSSLVGVACDGRHYEELTTTLGLYTRFVPLSVSLTENLSFERTLPLVAGALGEAVQKQEYFVWEQEPAPGKHEPAFFPVSFEYESWPARSSCGELTFSLLRCACCMEPFVVKLTVFQVGEVLRLEVHFDPARLSAHHVRRLSASLQALLRAAVARPSQPLRALPLLEEVEQRRLQHAFTGPRVAFQQTFQQLFEAQVERRPTLPALVCGNEQLTYEQLNARANQLARWLRRKGIGPNVLVGLCLERSVYMLIGLLAIFKAGGGYVPVDPEQPVTRLAALLADASVEVVLTQERLSARLEQWRGATIFLDSQSAMWARESASNLHIYNDPGDLAYVIYTSGSTGVPKGVMIRHESVSNYTQGLCALLVPEPGLHFATVSTLAADLGNTAIFCSLATGGCLHILAYGLVTSGESFASYVCQHPLDVLKIVPSHLSALLNSVQDGSKILPRKFLILGGEALPWRLYERLREMGCRCRVINHYGPTETTIGALVNGLEEGKIGEYGKRTIPIGRPIANTEAYILDQYQHMAPAGMVGELYLSGAGLALGYLHEPEQTAERFIPHPFAEGARLYRTGDLVWSTEDGLIEFVERADNQVKVRGYRVEPGEIEAALRQHANVWDNVVLQQDTQLVAYVLPRKLPAPASGELHSFLEHLLPEYMIPSLFICLEAFPLTQNGKIDRRQLPQVQQSERVIKSIYNAPRSPIEEALVEIFREVLALEQTGIQDNFFRLGGHSLLAMQVISRIRTLLQVDLPIISLFEAPTVAELARLMEQELYHKQGAARPALVPVSREQDLPLSFAQQRLWFLDQLEPGSVSYNMPIALRLQGALNVSALLHGLNMIVQRYEILRTTFRLKEDGQPAQYIEPVKCFITPVVDFSEWDLERDEAQKLIQQEAHRPFDLARGPLLRITLLRSSRNEHILLLTMHHIISDGWSNTIFLHELATLYDAFVEGRPPSSSSLSIQYADFAVWQRHWLQSEALEKQISYWTAQLRGLAPLNVPADYLRPPVQTFRGAHQGCMLPAALSEQIKELSQREGVTLFMTLLAAFQVLLARYSGQTDIAVGTPIANRNLTEIERVIGFFVNTLVLRTDLSSNPTFQELLARVRRVTLGAYAHQDVPFEKLVEVLQPERDPSRSPLFQVMFALQHDSDPLQPLSGLTVSNISQEMTIAKFDLLLAVTQTRQGLVCGIEYNTDLFNTSTIKGLLGHWQTMLEGLCQDAQQQVEDIPLLTKAEREQILVSWNETHVAYPRKHYLHRLLEEQVERTPEALAVVFEDKQCTYHELNTRTNQLAHHLQGLGVGPEVRVGLCVERSLEMAVALLAILKAGGAYVPLDPVYPKERLAFMLEDAQAPILLTQERLVARLPVHSARTVCLDADWDAIACENVDSPINSVTGENLAYMIYTSGSTGQPKGVLIQHEGLLNVTLSACARYQLAPGDRVLQFASLSFDTAAEEIYPCLLSGATLVIRSEDMLDSIQKFLRCCAELGLTVLNFPTAYWHLLVTELPTSPLRLPDTLRLTIIGGEKALAERLALWKQAAPPAVRLVNTYGPTETTIVATLYESPTSGPINAEMPIGRAIQNIHTYILDQRLQPVPVGIAGELYLGGIGLARGYQNRPDLTAERFPPHPFSDQPGARLYKTEDLARYRADGTVEFLGRKDSQVKIRGYRIELGEIEAVLSQHPAVRECVVLAREDTPGDRRLVAYVVAQQAALPETSPAALSGLDLLHYLQARLPDYMLPFAFVLLTALPLSPTRKVDRLALPPPDAQRLALSSADAPPRSDMERLVAATWQEVLGLDKVGVHDKFFDLGGHSLLAIQARSRLQARLGREIALIDLFKYPSVAALAAFLSQQQAQHSAVQAITRRSELRKEALHRPKPARRARQETHP